MMCLIIRIFVCHFPPTAASRTNKEDDLEAVLDRYDLSLHISNAVSSVQIAHCKSGYVQCVEGNDLLICIL